MFDQLQIIYTFLKMSFTVRFFVLSLFTLLHIHEAAVSQEYEDLARESDSYFSELEQQGFSGVILVEKKGMVVLKTDSNKEAQICP